MGDSLTLSLVVQLGEGATGGRWKVDIYEFVGSDTWVTLGDLNGGESLLLFR